MMQVVSLGLFELRCDEVLRSLIKRTEAICSLLLSRMSQDNQKHNQMYIRYEFIGACKIDYAAVFKSML